MKFDLFKAIEKRTGFKVDYDQKEFELITDIDNWIHRRSNKLDESKGLLIYGGVGVGKTIITKAIQDVVNFYDFEKYYYTTSDWITQDVNANGDTCLFAYRLKNRIVDDIGSEGVSNSYGNRRLVINNVIKDRYESFQTSGLKTIFTTNVDLNKLSEIYGDREVSRVTEMCNVIIYPSDKSKRNMKERTPIEQTEPMTTSEPTREKKIESREYIVKQIIDQFNSLQDELFESDEAKIHEIDAPRLFLDVLSDFGYELVSNDQKRKMYAQRRSIELERIGYWMQKGKKHEFKSFADKRFMSTSKQSQERNEVHNYVVRKCRIEMLNELYKGQIKSNEDFESDILRRFEVWKRKV